MLMRLLRRSPIEPELAFWVWARGSSGVVGTLLVGELLLGGVVVE